MTVPDSGEGRRLFIFLQLLSEKNIGNKLVVTRFLRKTQWLGKVVLDICEADGHHVFERRRGTDDVQEEVTADEEGQADEDGETNHGEDRRLLRRVLREGKQSVCIVVLLKRARRTSCHSFEDPRGRQEGGQNRAGESAD